jgi:zinc finger HIT domain-containing protein 1
MKVIAGMRCQLASERRLVWSEGFAAYPEELVCADSDGHFEHCTHKKQYPFSSQAPVYGFGPCRLRDVSEACNLSEVNSVAYCQASSADFSVQVELHFLSHHASCDLAMPLIEVLPSTGPSKASQPGWAYVPDTGPVVSVQPGQRKRGRDGNIIGSSAKQQKAIEQRLKDLDKENYKDVIIPLPKSDRDRKGRKMTTNVRRILGYNRNFGHYLADEEASIAAGAGSSVAASATATVASGHRDGKRRLEKETAVPPPIPKRASKQPGSMAPPSIKSATPLQQEDVEMTSPTSSPKRPRSQQSQQHPLTASQPPPYPPEYDQDPLLRTRDLPSRPSDRVMAQLLAEPPLSYSAARAKPLDPDKQTPERHFCIMCGYWGKVKCRKCGERTCGLMECWKGHEAAGCGQNIY